MRGFRLSHESVALCEGLASAIEAYANDLWDHVARALDDDSIAYAEILALEFVLIVERCVRDRDASDANRAKPGHGREGAGAANLDLDAFEHGLHLFRRKLEGDRPAGCAGQIAEFGLLCEGVDLEDAAVDFNGQLAP